MITFRRVSVTVTWLALMASTIRAAERSAMCPRIAGMWSPFLMRWKRERNSHAENQKEAGEHHVHVRHRVDFAGSVISPPGQAFYLCELVDEDHERDVESAKYQASRFDDHVGERGRGTRLRGESPIGRKASRSLR